MAWESYRPQIHNKWKQYWFDTHSSDIASVSWDYLFTGGKEIRARLFCELWTYLSPESIVDAELAFAIECIHAASLILDDTPWMDNATTRRGKPTLHLTLSKKKAVLLCHDVMYMVYLIWQEHKPEHVSVDDWQNVIVDILQRLMIGQWYDLEKKGSLYELASMKTGVLFELVSETVAICTKLDRQAWKVWGNYLGVLFQWMDDWHDQEEDIEQQNRNAFNESYDWTLAEYGLIWNKLEKEIGASWFQRPFGKFMKQYFTTGIPLTVTIGLTINSLVEVQTPLDKLPSLYPDMPSNDTMLYNEDTIITVNGKNVYNLTRDDIREIIQSKKEVVLTRNGTPIYFGDYDDLFHLELLEWINVFNENNAMNIKGIQLIRILLRVLQHLKLNHKKYIEQYRVRYESWKQKIWNTIDQEEDITEIVDIIYDEIQSKRFQNVF
jgi:geranylgeranyl diphosphate synthase type II